MISLCFYLQADLMNGDRGPPTSICTVAVVDTDQITSRMLLPLMMQMPADVGFALGVLQPC